MDCLLVDTIVTIIFPEVAGEILLHNLLARGKQDKVAFRALMDFTFYPSIKSYVCLVCFDYLPCGTWSFYVYTWRKEKTKKNPSIWALPLKLRVDRGSL